MRIGVGTQFALSVFSWWLVSSANVWASPDGDCIVAAAARDTRVADAQTLLMADDQRLYRVDLAQTCPALLELHSISLRAREGRLCGSRGEAVIANGDICEVARVMPIEASEYAQRAGMSETQLAVELPPQLDTTDVTAPRLPRSFTSGKFCFDPNRATGWQLIDGNRLRVDLRRRGKVELTLATSCPELERASGVFFRSGLGLGAICGNAGDRIVPFNEAPQFAGPLESSLITCFITRVEPVLAQR